MYSFKLNAVENRFANHMFFRYIMILMISGIFLAGCEIRPIDPETGEVIIEDRHDAFQAQAFVDEIWEEKVLLAFEVDAVELTTLIDLLAENPDSAREYGFRQGSRPFAFLVKGSGTVVGMDTSSRVGYLELQVPSLGNDLEVRLQIGPVISGTALRDALPFIEFDQFTNQMEYAAVSRALHEHLLNSMLENLNFEELSGKVISFAGAFIHNSDQIVITPVKIETEHER